MANTKIKLSKKEETRRLKATFCKAMMWGGLSLALVAVVNHLLGVWGLVGVILIGAIALRRQIRF